MKYAARSIAATPTTNSTIRSQRGMYPQPLPQLPFECGSEAMISWVMWSSRRVESAYNRMGFVADIYIEYLVRVFIRAIRLVRSRDWPVIQATILSAECPRAGYGCTVATVYYEYIVEGQKYGADFEEPFIVGESGERFAGSFVKAADFAVRINPWDASVTVPC